MENLEGMNAVHAAWLHKAGVDDAAGLATADLCRLLVGGQFHVLQLVDWVDHALLTVQVGAPIERFRRLGIRTLSDLRAAALNLDVAQRARLAAELGWPQAGLTAIIAGESDLPNAAHVAAFHKITARDMRRRAGQLIGLPARP